MTARCEQRAALPAGLWLFVGTIPDADFPLTLSAFAMEKERLCLDGGRLRIAVNRGTPAMLTAARLTCDQLTRDRVCPGAHESCCYMLAAGDSGTGQGSRLVYQRLIETLPELRPRGITFHYLLPDVDWHNRILLAVEALPQRPILIADAGYMYAAKMSGYAEQYDLFTPDIGELAFLADELAPHPFYTRNFLLADEEQAEELISSAYAGHNAAKHMLVKGGIDRYVHEGRVAETVDGPDIPMLEPIGGTGDTLTGIASALLASGLGMRAACVAAFRINRRMGLLARPNPASSIMDLLEFLPEAVRQENEVGNDFSSKSL